jgi:hypothetical protein
LSVRVVLGSDVRGVVERRERRALRVAVWIRASVTSDAEERVPAGGELTLIEAAGRVAWPSLVVSLVAGRGCPA